MKHPRHWLYWFAGLGVVLALAATATEHARAQSLGEGGNYGLIAPFAGGTVTTAILAPTSADTTSAPGYAFSGHATTGLGYDGTYVYLINGGSRVAYINTSTFGTDLGFTASGTITSAAGSDIGWTLQTAANQACNTTCTYACVLGWNTASGEVAVSCSDATADKCLCAGAS